MVSIIILSMVLMINTYPIDSLYTLIFKTNYHNKLKFHFNTNLNVRKFNEEYIEDIDEDNNEIEYERDSKSWMNVVRNMYDNIFFYGLDIPNIKSYQITPKIIKNYKKQQSKISKNNPFLTPSEQLGLYLIELKKNDNKNINNNNNKNINNNNVNDINSNKNQNNRIIKKKDNINYDLNDIKDIDNSINEVKNIIFFLDNEKQVLKITSDIIMNEENINNTINDSNNNELNTKINMIDKEINNNKIKLITLQALKSEYDS